MADFFKTLMTGGMVATSLFEARKTWANVTNKNMLGARQAELYKIKIEEDNFNRAKAKTESTLKRNITAKEIQDAQSQLVGQLASSGINPTSGTGLAITQRNQNMLNAKKFLQDAPLPVNTTEATMRLAQTVLRTQRESPFLHVFASATQSAAFLHYARTSIKK